MHKQKRIPVNVWIDEKLIPLVEALNQHEDIITWESCQEDKTGRAHVTFTTRLPEMLYPKIRELSDMLKGCELFWLDLELVWSNGGEPVGIIRCSSEIIEEVAKLLKIRD